MRKNVNWRRGDRLEMRDERRDRTNTAWDEEGQRAEQPILAQFIGTENLPNLLY